MRCQEPWIVYSTALCPPVILVMRGAERGIVRDFTQEEWRAAFHAPSRPYPWTGGDNRIEQVRP